MVRGEQGFGREHRLQRRTEFRRVYETGRRSSGRHAVVFALREGQGPWRLGITTTRRVGTAVRRNRMRRLVREFFRRRGPWLPEGWWFVVNVRPGSAVLSQADLDGDLASILGRLGLPVPTGSRGGADRVQGDDQLDA